LLFVDLIFFLFASNVIDRRVVRGVSGQRHCSTLLEMRLEVPATLATGAKQSGSFFLFSFFFLFSSFFDNSQ